MRRSLAFVLVGLLTVLATLMMSGAPAQAAIVTGITNGKFGSAQAFSAAHNFNTFCASNAVPPITVSNLQSPVSDASDVATPLGSNYLMIQASGDVNRPWRLALFTSTNQELRWNGATWVVAPSGGFTTELPFAATGSIVVASSTGLIFLSQEGYTTFVNPTEAVVTDPYTFSPGTSQFNQCQAGTFITQNLGNLSVSDSPFPPAPGSGQDPPDVLQQFGRPATGSCDASASSDLNWAGVGSGGWGESWAQWMNEGRGGQVCTRTLIHRQYRWQVA